MGITEFSPGHGDEDRLVGSRWLEQLDRHRQALDDQEQQEQQQASSVEGRAAASELTQRLKPDQQAVFHRVGSGETIQQRVPAASRYRQLLLRRWQLTERVLVTNLLRSRVRCGQLVTACLNRTGEDSYFMAGRLVRVAAGLGEHAVALNASGSAIQLALPLPVVLTLQGQLGVPLVVQRLEERIAGRADGH